MGYLRLRIVYGCRKLRSNLSRLCCQLLDSISILAYLTKGKRTGISWSKRLYYHRRSGLLVAFSVVLWSLWCFRGPVNEGCHLRGYEFLPTSTAKPQIAQYLHVSTSDLAANLWEFSCPNPWSRLSPSLTDKGVVVRPRAPSAIRMSSCRCSLLCHICAAELR